MTPNDRIRIDLAAARYLDALERDDQPALDALWAQAANDLHSPRSTRSTSAWVRKQRPTTCGRQATAAAAVAEHLPAAEIVKRRSAPSRWPMSRTNCSDTRWTGCRPSPCVERALAVCDRPLPADIGLERWPPGRGPVRNRPGTGGHSGPPPTRAGCGGGRTPSSSSPPGGRPRSRRAIDDPSRRPGRRRGGRPAR